MNTIKLPKNAIDFFKSNQDKIFDTGKLAEGPWNEELSKKSYLVYSFEFFRASSCLFNSKPM